MTDATIKGEETIPDATLVQAQQGDQPTVVETEFRLLGNMGDELIRLVADDHELATVADTAGYSDEPSIRQTLRSLKPGNLIKASLEGIPGAREPWRFRSLERLSTEQLVFLKGVETDQLKCLDGYDTMWDNRDDGPTNWPAPVYIPTTPYADSDPEHIPDDGFYHEAQLIPPANDGEDTWSGMLSGHLRIHDYFDETTFLESGAQFILILNIRTRPYHVAMFVPKVHTTHFEALYDHFGNPDS